MSPRSSGGSRPRSRPKWPGGGRRLRFHLENRKIVFEQEVSQLHREIKTRDALSDRRRSACHLVAPVIYSLIIPMVLLDLAVMAYQAICFPVYRIPKVRRRDYLVFSRGAPGGRLAAGRGATGGPRRDSGSRRRRRAARRTRSATERRGDRASLRLADHQLHGGHLDRRDRPDRASPASRRASMNQVPGGAQNFVEWLVESLYGSSKASSGRSWSSARSGSSPRSSSSSSPPTGSA